MTNEPAGEWRRYGDHSRERYLNPRAQERTRLQACGVRHQSDKYGEVQQMESEEPVPVVTIKRDYALHSWVYIGFGAHPPTIPWSDETPADVVIRYLKTKANGRITVRVDLG